MYFKALGHDLGLALGKEGSVCRLAVAHGQVWTGAYIGPRKWGKGAWTLPGRRLQAEVYALKPTALLFGVMLKSVILF